MTAIARIRERLDEMVTSSRSPGLQFLALNAEGPLLSYCGGWADLAARLAMRPDTTLMAYSMSKTFTAVAVLQLVEAGLVDLDHQVDRYVAHHPYGPGVSIRRLLSHTAGLPNPIPLRWIHSPAGHDRFDEHAALAGVLRRYGRLAATPGSAFRYSNIGYWLLGEVIEAASGRRFTDYVAERVLQPLGIAPRELGYRIVDIDNHARGYLEKYSFFNLAKRLFVDSRFIGSYSGRWLEIRAHHVDGAAYGGLAGHAGGIARFLQDQLRPRSSILGDPGRRALYEQQHTGKGSDVPMSLGWHVGQLRGTRCYFKEGGGGGFHGLMRLYPTAGLATVVLGNATLFDVRRLLDATDKELLANH